MSSLTPEQIDHYQDQGFLVLPELFSEALIDRVADESERLMEDAQIIKEGNLRCRRRPHMQTGELMLDALEPARDLSHAIEELTQHEGLHERLASLFGEPACLMKDKLIYKPAGSKGLPLHQDYIAWPDFPKTCTLVLISIDVSIRENGCIEVFPGCHKDGYLSPRDGRRFHALDPAKLKGHSSKLIELFPGDVLIYHCMLPHQAGPNLTDEPRRHVYLAYNARSDGGDQRDHHYDRFFTREWRNAAGNEQVNFFR